jgi:hypothetical protein
MIQHIGKEKAQLILFPRHQNTHCCTDKSPYPGAGCNDSTAATAFPKISDQATYSGSYQRTENISHHGYDFLLVIAVNSEIFFCILSLPQ